MNDLSKLIEDARKVSMTKDESEKQRLNFALGNSRIENPKITRDMILRAAVEIDRDGNH